ncbi:hypothetical protein Bca52824_009732 [Brassica carinata]|uniref:RBR-type E3 ubiquitin transferase n=1 Tax=Brassica carinata TaxID=52824 RepID=A0A8X7WC89_BRACI|nr:hypothetical protein Bca52824_009732 [Brassica carinata]
MADDDLQKPYSVYTIDDLKEKVDKQIDAISDIFCVSNSDATVLLMKLGWNSELLQERMSEDEKKLLMESGLIPVVVTDSNQDLLSDSSCDEFYEFFDDVDDDDNVKISTPFCCHKFSTTYWSNYLEKNFFSVEKKTLDTISCPHQDCGASVGRDTIENLTVKDKDMYEGYVLRSYLESKKTQIKQCPARGCSYFIEYPPRIGDDGEYGLNVVCLCGHTFCWRCRLESHRPVTCNNASDWLSRDLKKLSKSLSGAWIDANTKPCLHCLTPVEIGVESHKTESGTDGDCLEHVTEQDLAEVDTLCLDRWEAGEASLVEARSELQAFEESNNTTLREGLMLIVQCRQFLKWSCVYEHLYLEHEASKKEFLRFLQDYASTLVQSYAETLKEETKKALSKPTLDEVTCSGGDLSTATSSIGNYFYNLSKALKDGLDALEVRHYDDFSPCWLCDRCTYANTWLHKACQMCCDESLVEKAK